MGKRSLLCGEAGGRNRGEGDVNLLLLILERRGTGKDAL